MSATVTGGRLHVGTTDLLDHATRIEPLLRERAAENEAAGRLVPEVVEALTEGRTLGMWVPAALGGSELTPRQSLEVLEQLAYGDASTSWVVMAAALSVGVAGAYLPDAGVAEIFAGEAIPVMAGQGTRPGTAKPVTGGYEVSGSWSFASGIKHAAFIHTAAIVEGTGEPRIFNPRVDEATLTDNWDVLGLRATGSIDYELDAVFVPEERSHPVLIDVPLRGGSLYRLGIINFAGICHSGWALGVGRRLLDELRELVVAKAGRAGTVTDSDAFHESFAEAEVRLRAARALVFETWADIEETLDAGEPCTVRQDTLNRLALNNVTWSVHAVAQFVYAAAGTTALRAGAIQRYFRDLHAGTQHITSASAVKQACGRELAGLAEGKRWVFLDLADGS
jgi:alkylation response protein AidB-like acyl-CoA dehydrogenase